MQLFGSTTSPFVRRFCLWLTKDEYEFVNLDIFSKEGRTILKANNPTLKIPMIKDGEQTIYDSRVIYRYLNNKLGRETLSWDEENNLTLIDSASDSFIELLLLDRSGVDLNGDLMFVKLQKERTFDLMRLLNDKVLQGEFEQWNYAAISLYCLIDWVQFRSMFDTADFAGLNQFKRQNLVQPQITDTDPRN